MAESLDKNVDLRARRSRLIGQLLQLAARMENKELNVDSVGLKNNDEQLCLTQYKIQAGKLLFELYGSGECPNGTLCQILGYWSKNPYPESADWNYVQGFESVCWEWYGTRFGNLKKELGELRAYAYVIRLVIGPFQHQDID